MSFKETEIVEIKRKHCNIVTGLHVRAQLLLHNSLQSPEKNMMAYTA